MSKTQQYVFRIEPKLYDYLKENKEQYGTMNKMLNVIIKEWIEFKTKEQLDKLGDINNG